MDLIYLLFFAFLMIFAAFLVGFIFIPKKKQKFKKHALDYFEITEGRDWPEDR